MDIIKIKIIIIGLFVFFLIGGNLYEINMKLDSIQNKLQANSDIIQSWDIHLNE